MLGRNSFCAESNRYIAVLEATPIGFKKRINPNRSGGWHNVPQNFHLNLILLVIVHPDGNRTIFSRALLDADFGPVGRNQHPARLRERTLC